jgi:hypothetical protein
MIFPIPFSELQVKDFDPHIPEDAWCILTGDIGEE